MLRYIIRRVLMMIPTVLVIVTLVFSLLHLAPGDPVTVLAGDLAHEETLERIRAEYGLDRPLPEQLVVYVSRVAQLDFGRSIITSAPVRDMIAERLPNTIQLAAIALLIATVLGILIGLFTATRYGSPWDLGALVFATVLVSAPSFWLGLMLMVVFAVLLGWLPAAGMGGPQHFILPAVTLSGYTLALVARMVRSGSLEVMAQDYVRTARAKGLRERSVLVRHVFRNALLPVITMVGLQIGHALNGSVVIESVFAWPGVGTLLIEGINRRDFPVVQGTLVVVGVGFAIVNLVVDIAYAYVDPRIRYK